MASTLQIQLADASIVGRRFFRSALVRLDWESKADVCRAGCLLLAVASLLFVVRADVSTLLSGQREKHSQRDIV